MKLIQRLSVGVVVAILGAPFFASAATSPAVQGVVGGVIGGVAANTLMNMAKGVPGSTAADAMCNPVIPQCPCNQVPNPKGGCMAGTNKFMCPPGVSCMAQTPVGPVPGQCTAPNVCKATSAPGQGGGNTLDQGLGMLGQLLGQLLPQLLKAAQGGSESGSQSPQPNSSSQSCTSMQPTSDQSLPTYNPCYYYVAPVSGQLNDSGNTNSVSDLLNSLNSGSTGTSVGDILNSSEGTGTSSNTGGTVTSSPDPSENTAGTGRSNVTDIVFTTPLSNLGTGKSPNFSTPKDIVQSIIQKDIRSGTYGDVKILENGTTIVAGVRDSSSEVAGFYGINGSGTTGLGPVQRLCQSRPWSKNFLSYLIPASFFDGLCSLRGYQVGSTPSTGSVSNTGGAIKPTNTTFKITQPAPAVVATTSVPTIPVRVDIWASPASVPIGARTSIFWNTQGVTECIETSPDGSFSHNSLKGGASTVPLTAPTVFTISCIGPDGRPVVSNVTVLIGI